MAPPRKGARKEPRGRAARSSPEALKREVLSRFRAQGRQSGATWAASYDASLMRMDRAAAVGAVRTLLLESVSVDDAANDAAGRLMEAGIAEDPSELGIEVGDAYWAGVVEGAGEAYDRMRAAGYRPSSTRRLPISAGGGGILGAVLRAVKH